MVALGRWGWAFGGVSGWGRRWGWFPLGGYSRPRIADRAAEGMVAVATDPLGPGPVFGSLRAPVVPSQLLEADSIRGAAREVQLASHCWVTRDECQTHCQGGPRAGQHRPPDAEVRDLGVDHAWGLLDTAQSTLA